jgi:hypothetical protein
MRELREAGAGIVAVTHDEAFVAALADDRCTLGVPSSASAEVTA